MLIKTIFFIALSDVSQDGIARTEVALYYSMSYTTSVQRAGGRIRTEVAVYYSIFYTTSVQRGGGRITGNPWVFGVLRHTVCCYSHCATSDVCATPVGATVKTAMTIAFSNAVRAERSEDRHRLTQSLGYRFSYQGLLQLLCHFDVYTTPVSTTKLGVGDLH